MRVLRIALIGAGYMGTLHARKLRGLQEEAGAEGVRVDLIGIADIDFPRAERLAQRLGGRPVRDFRSLLPECDAAVVAVPTLAHYQVVDWVLRAGKDVLVEKPIAATLEQAEGLMKLAEARACVLQVGHLEWFNSAMQVLRQHIRRPRFIEAHRMGPFPDRPTDIDVVRDLMIHDLDIVQQLLGSEPLHIESVGVPVVTESADIANARLTYADGVVANLTASRASPTRMRKLRFFQENGYFSIDFLDQAAVVYRRVPTPPGSAPRIEAEKLEVDRGDALLAQLQAFVRACVTRERPRVDGQGGLGALRTALRVSEAMPPYDSQASLELEGSLEAALEAAPDPAAVFPRSR